MERDCIKKLKSRKIPSYFIAIDGKKKFGVRNVREGERDSKRDRDMCWTGNTFRI